MNKNVKTMMKKFERVIEIAPPLNIKAIFYVNITQMISIVFRINVE